MAPAHSSADAARPSGTVLFRAVESSSAVIPRLAATSASTRSCIGVSMMPGQMALTRTPFGAKAYAKERVIDNTAAFDEAYTAASVVVASLADDDEKIHDRPPGRHRATDPRHEVPRRLDVDGVDPSDVIDGELEDGLQQDDARRIDQVGRPVARCDEAIAVRRVRQVCQERGRPVRDHRLETGRIPIDRDDRGPFAQQTPGHRLADAAGRPGDHG